MKRILLLFAGMFALVTVAMAQQPVLQFDETSHDFGKVKEDDGSVTYRFRFTNTGNSDLVISRVQPGCGCTVAKCAKDTIAPGSEGCIEATFSVAHRQGMFNKSISIYSNAKEGSDLLTIKGEVIPKGGTDEDKYTFGTGSVKMESLSLNFDKQYNNLTDVVRELSIINTGSSPVTIKSFSSENALYFSIKDLPLTLQPHKPVKLPLHLNPAMVNDFGLMFGEGTLIIEGDNTPFAKINMQVDIQQYIPEMKQGEKALSAVISFDKNVHDFSKVTEGEIVTAVFPFTNKGQNELVVFTTKASCGCTFSTVDKSKIKPGETSFISVKFNAAGRMGKQNKSITIYTNDPVNPVSTLEIKANVVPKSDVIVQQSKNEPGNNLFENVNKKGSLIAQNIHIYPNPTTDIVKIDFTNAGLHTDAVLLSITGQELMMSKDISNHSEFNLSGLAPGIYFIRLQNENGAVVEKVVKE